MRDVKDMGQQMGYRSLEWNWPKVAMNRPSDFQEYILYGSPIWNKKNVGEKIHEYMWSYTWIEVYFYSRSGMEK